MKARQRRKLRQWAARSRDAMQRRQEREQDDSVLLKRDLGPARAACYEEDPEVTMDRSLATALDDGEEPGTGYTNPDVDPDAVPRGR